MNMKLEDIAMPEIEICKDTQTKFSSWLKDAMEQNNIFDERAHKYLTQLMSQYAKWEEDKENSLRPSIHTRTTDAFILQTINAEMSTLSGSLRYGRLKSIADTLLFSVGFMPESISSTAVRERPSLDYYIATGQVNYDKAAHAIRKVDHTDARAELMITLAYGFKKYAGTIFRIRQEATNSPVTNIDILQEVARVIGDEDAFVIYDLEMRRKRLLQ